MKDSFQQIFESALILKKTKRVFYPKNFHISKQFSIALDKEIENQLKNGNSKNELLNKFSRILEFHIDKAKLPTKKDVQEFEKHPKK